jgi:hypothetical protein
VAPFEGDMDDYARFVLERSKLGSAPSQLRHKAEQKPERKAKHEPKGKKKKAA